ncbi:hypothetical protein ETB97_008614 [Aspergillus alliaceus]|uniref:Actin-like ATPase domain-containing protein n=1 Tax=Petromyces alliaceus TaxID=209559 RepID=A0A8H5ZWI4_PETAA|nr:hypothetical protein ETB97_008614 [Aspergillus burnettii]
MSDKEVVTTRTQVIAEAWDGWNPDVVVGIDFGMTYTGVAYSCAPEWLPPKTIQRWPGKLPGELANKVPTCLEYCTQTQTIRNWGFSCDSNDHTSEIREFFKLHLAPQYQDLGGPSRQEAQGWFQDYVQCVYQHVVSHFSSTMPQFASRKVEFLFSVPTTWKDIRMVEETRTLLERAINEKTPNHRAFIGLTEAEAAAVYAGKEHYQADDTILICDSGGGTTDVNTLRLISSRGEPTRLEQLGHVEGQPIGSVFIDRRMHQLICKNLEKVRNHLRLSPSDAAWRMTSDRFQRLKCAFGTEATLSPWLKLDVPSLLAESDLPEADIYNGQMRIAWEYVKECFDLKIAEICRLLDDQISQMHARYPKEQIAYLILSGGFGSSSYVKKCLVEKYTNPDTKKYPNIQRMQILLADEPQLVVVHGLVLDRIQQIKHGVITFGTRCSPASYGIICDQIYDPAKHIGEPVRRDSRDNKIYAMDQVDWLVIQGRPIPHTGFTKEFQFKADPGQESELRQVRVVMSILPPNRLPRSMSQGGLQVVCSLDIETDDVDKKLKNGHWYSLKPAFWRTVFDVKVVVGPADLSFQLWSKDRRIRGSKHEPITVKWMPAKALDEEKATY